MDTPVVSNQLHLAAPEILLATDTDAPLGQRGLVEVVAALRCLEGLIAPLTLEAELEAVDPNLGIALAPSALPRPFHRLAAVLPGGVEPRPRLPDPIEVRVNALEPAVVGDWLSAIVDQEATGLEVAWKQLTMTAARVWTSETFADRVELTNLEAQPFSVPAVVGSQGTWLAGPTAASSIDPPIRLTFTQEGHRSRLALAVVWPLWSEPGSPGRALLTQRVAQLAELGWVLERRDPLA